jgi:hypothetical protein
MSSLQCGHGVSPNGICVLLAGDPGTTLIFIALSKTTILILSFSATEVTRSMAYHVFEKVAKLCPQGLQTGLSTSALQKSRDVSGKQDLGCST